MAAYDVRPSVGAGVTRPGGVPFLVGIVLALAGIVVLGDIVLAATVSPVFIGVSAAIAGAFEITLAFWTLRQALKLAIGLALCLPPVCERPSDAFDYRGFYREPD
jgi:uncharacterized membrane protein HdeD (DUF308 family)